MLVLMLFAFIAGAGTAITPCVLPVVPALLASSATGGRRRPIGIVLGLAATFTIAIVLLAQLVKGVGLASGAARTFAIVVLFVFGFAMLIPDVAARVQAPLSRLDPGGDVRDQQRDSEREQHDDRQDPGGAAGQADALDELSQQHDRDCERGP